MSNKPNLKPAYIQEEKPKPYTGFAIDDPAFKPQVLNKPAFPDAVVKSEPHRPVKKRVEEINNKNTDNHGEVVKPAGWFAKLIKKARHRV